MAYKKKESEAPAVETEETVVPGQIDTLAEFEPAFKAIAEVIDHSLRYTFRHSGEERTALEDFLAEVYRRVAAED